MNVMRFGLTQSGYFPVVDDKEIAGGPYPHLSVRIFQEGLDDRRIIYRIVISVRVRFGRLKTDRFEFPVAIDRNSPGRADPDIAFTVAIDRVDLLIAQPGFCAEGFNDPFQQPAAAGIRWH